mmetsp:Transcript_456/g.830  ORF Transcript_456/g.830 Transcript_456/m.830 type:complete len:80 (+) Transcript_456:150-389(+)
MIRADLFFRHRNLALFQDTTVSISHGMDLPPPALKKRGAMFQAIQRTVDGLMDLATQLKVLYVQNNMHLVTTLAQVAIM